MRTCADAGVKGRRKLLRSQHSHHALGAMASVALLAVSVACEQDPAAPDTNATPPKAPVLSVARGRVIEPGDGGIPAFPSADRGRFTKTVSAAGLRGLEDIAFDPTSGHLHVLDPAVQLLYEISETGRIVATRDVSEFHLVDPTGMIFAPTGDATDDPSKVGLYVASGGRVTELSVDQPMALTAAAATATLVQTTLTSSYTPPSPDPSGLAYASHLNRLVIGDGEVDEMSIYAGANMFEATLTGSLSRTWTTLPGSREPVGVAYNPTNRHLFFSDDDQREIYEVDPGLDGQYGTSDDLRTSFDTRAFGSTDPEGLAYDVAQGVLFVIDGANAQVYRVSPGPNGVFDGMPPAGDDEATSFDTQVHGLTDPEGLAYDSDLGHLYAVGRPSNLLFQFSTTGALLGTIDIAAARAVKPAGLEYVAASGGSSTPTLYLVARGVDNDGNPTENDGKMYAFSLPAPVGNTAPTVTITAPSSGATFAQGTTVTLTGTASDAQDGNLTAALTWTSSRDGALGSGGSLSTTALTVGTHTITASVTDADGAPGSAAVEVTITSAGSGSAVQVRVAASADDAEESATGAVVLNSSDLELTLEDDNQTVGMRFNGVAVPQGATITHAYVQFQVDEASSQATSLVIAGQAADNAAIFTTATGNVSSRARTASTVPWSPAPWTTGGLAGPDQQTPNLASIVQEIVNRPGWQSGNSLAVIITGTGRRVAEAYNGLAAAAPLLRVEYSTGGNTSPAATAVAISGTAQVGSTLTGSYTYADADGDVEGTSTYRWLRDGVPIAGATARTYTLTVADQATLIAFEVTPVAVTGASPGAPAQSATVGPVAGSGSETFVAVRVAASSDDAEEKPTGRIDLTSTDLELVYDGGDQTVGMRFNGVAIPQGATITRAFVQFQVDEPTTQTTAVTIAGQAADNPATFSSTAGDISSRARTVSSVAWSPVSWTVVGEAGAKQQTPDLAAIVQEIVNRPGWSSGNSLILIVTGTGRRIAKSYNGAAAAAPLLRVEFSLGSATP